VQVTVNGAPADVDEDATVAAVVRRRTGEHRRVAVAVNGDVVPRSAWDVTRLTAGDIVEVLIPVAGG